MGFSFCLRREWVAAGWEDHRRVTATWGFLSGSGSSDVAVCSAFYCCVLVLLDQTDADDERGCENDDEDDEDIFADSAR